MTAPIQLGEGNTPLVQSARIGRSLGLNRLFFKLELCNPTGSYKDRFVSMEVGRILSSGMRGCVATSSGNTGSSLAAYCARAGIPCSILVGEDVPEGKLIQMRVHGARVVRVRKFVVSPLITRAVYKCLARLSRSGRIAVVVSGYRYCPAGMRGVESIAREIRQQCTLALTHIFVPVGGGGLFSAICRGFAKQPSPRPRIHAIQPEGCSTVVAAFQNGENRIQPVQSTSRISGLSVPIDIDGQLALRQLRKLGGFGLTVTDEEVLEAQRLLLHQEGIWAEPAGATALAGLVRALKEKVISCRDTAICVVTGHGFKDLGSVKNAARQDPAPLIASTELRDFLSRWATSCV